MQYGWKALFKDGTVIDQYTDVDNTMELSKTVLPRQEELEHFEAGNGIERIGINFITNSLVVDNTEIPFISNSQKKLVYFMTRHADINAGEVVGEAPRIHTVGFQNEEGKLFISMQEGTGAWKISNENP